MRIIVTWYQANHIAWYYFSFQELKSRPHCAREYRSSKRSNYKTVDNARLFIIFISTLFYVRRRIQVNEETRRTRRSRFRCDQEALVVRWTRFWLARALLSFALDSTDLIPNTWIDIYHHDLSFLTQNKPILFAAVKIDFLSTYDVPCLQIASDVKREIPLSQKCRITEYFVAVIKLPSKT